MIQLELNDANVTLKACSLQIEKTDKTAAEKIAKTLK